MKKLQLTLLGLVGVLLFGGCAQKETAISGDEKAIVVATNSETGSLDPAGSIALTYLAYSASALDELLTFDENGEIEYRAAVSYEVNEDSTEWTFQLREDALWSDGTPVTSADFINTMTRALDPTSGNGYANYLFPIKNAEAVYNGEAAPADLGVATPGDHTLVFYLEEPCVYFLDLLRLPVYTPSNQKYAKEVGSGWDKSPQTSLSNGPFYLAEYVPEQYFVLLKNVHYWNSEQVYLEKITYRFFDEQNAMANAYETGEVDVAVSLPSYIMKLYEDKPDLAVTDLIATRYIYPNLNVWPLNDIRIRKAISLAIDREELCRIVGQDTNPTLNLVAAYMKDKSTGNYFIDDGEAPFTENIKEARALLAEAGYPNGAGFPVLAYNYPSLEMDSDTAQVIKEQLKRNLNIDIELKAQELQVNYSERRAGNFDLCRMNWTADFADPFTYLSMLLSNSTYNCSGIQDTEYDEIITQSNRETDAAKRSELLHAAEQLAVGEQFCVIPLFTMKSVNLIRPQITGIKQIPASGALEYRYADVATGQQEGIEK